MPRVSVGLHELPDSPHFLYRFYDRTDALLYIGITKDPKTRFKWHRNNQPWWTDVDQAKTQVDFHPSRDAVLEAERKAIIAETPLYNDQHNLTVDTPTRQAIRDAVEEFADTILFHLLGHPDSVKDAIRDAEIDIAEQIADFGKAEESSPVLAATANVAERLLTAKNIYKSCVDTLQDWLPPDVVAAAYEQAVGDLSADDLSWMHDPDVIESAVSAMEAEMCKRYLAALPAEEAAEWRLAAKTFLSRKWSSRSHSVPSEDQIERHAALYAKAVDTEHPYLLAAHQCHGKGTHIPRCPNQADLKVAFGNCQVCKPDVGECPGHQVWCGNHLELGVNGEMFWVRTDEAAIIVSAVDMSKVDAETKV
jgi:NAD-dependent dihydropyrimidine dehydrogenase PreA subunit